VEAVDCLATEAASEDAKVGSDAVNDEAKDSHEVQAEEIKTDPAEKAPAAVS